MNALLTFSSALCLVLLASCAGSGSNQGNEHIAAEGLSSSLNRNYGYQVDDKGNWVPKTDKRSQYEGRGGSAYFNGAMKKKSYNAETLKKGAWLGGGQLDMPKHRLSGAESEVGGASRFSNEQASLDRKLRTPARIKGNHIPTGSAREGGASEIGRPSDAETDIRRRVFKEPDIIDYRQQRELSIQQSKQLLGRD